MFDLRNFFGKDDKPINDKNIYKSNNMDFSFDDEEDKTKNDDDKKDIVTKSNIISKMAKMLNLGMSKNKIIASLKEKYPSNDLSFVVNTLNNYAGIVGTICVDCSAIKDRQEYIANKNKYKSFNKYAINCNCDKNLISYVDDSMLSGNMDGFLQENKRIHNKKMGICKKTHLPSISSISNISDRDVVSAIYKLSSLGHFSKNVAKKILVENDRFTAIKKAFSYMTKQKTAPIKKGYYIKDMPINIEIDKEAKSNIKKISSSNVPINIEKEIIPSMSYQSIDISNKYKVYGDDMLENIEMDNISDIMKNVKDINVSISNENNHVYDEKTFDENTVFENIDFDNDIVFESQNVSSIPADVCFDIEDEREDDINVVISNENGNVNDSDDFSDNVSPIEDFRFDNITTESDSIINKISVEKESEIKL